MYHTSILHTHTYTHTQFNRRKWKEKEENVQSKLHEISMNVLEN